MFARKKGKLLTAIKFDWKVPENFTETNFRDWIDEELTFIQSRLENHAPENQREIIEKYVRDYEIRETPTGMTTGRHGIERSLVAAFNNFIITTPEAEDYLLIKTRIDAAGGAISFFLNERESLKNIDSPNLLLLDEIVKIYSMIPGSIAAPEPEISEPGGKYSGLNIINEDDFLDHLDDAHEEGYLIQENGKIILTETGNHNVLAVALYKLWVKRGFIHKSSRISWKSFCEIVKYRNGKGITKNLNNKTISGMYSEKRHKKKLEELEEKF